MIKISKLKLLITIAIFALLLISNAYVSAAPVANTIEPNYQDKTKLILNDVVGIDTQSFKVVLKSQVTNKFLSIPQEEVDISLTSDHGNIRVISDFVNNELHQMYFAEYAGDLSTTRSADSTVDMAKDFLEKYQNYVGDAIYGNLALMLNNINVKTNITKSVGNIKLDVLNSNQKIVDYTWTYIDENGIIAKSKNVILSYDQGRLKGFLNNWPLCKVVGTPKISADEATEIAVEASKNFSYEITTNNITSTITGFNIAPKSLGHATLSYLNFPNQSLARGSDPFTLYPSWYVPLGFDKFYPGDVTGMTVSIWADTDNISIMGPTVADSAFANAKYIQTQGFNQSSMVLFSVLLIMIIFSIGILTNYRNRVAKLSNRWKILRFSSLILCALIVSSVSLVIPEVSATSRAREYAALTGSDPPQLPQEQQSAIDVCNDLNSKFSTGGYNSINSCGSNTQRYQITTNAYSDEQTFDNIAIFHFGHLADFNIGYQDNDGLNVGYNYIYPNTALGKHSFVFIWVCAQAQDRTYGTPVAWTHRDGTQGHPYMSNDGYATPDYLGQCYIGFYCFSPIISGYYQTFDPYSTNYPCADFIKFFYYYALTGLTVNAALDQASIWYFGSYYSSSIFNQGYNAWWPGGMDPPLDVSGYYPEDFYPNNPLNRMIVFGDGTMKIFPPNPPAKPTINGPSPAPPTYVNGNYQFSAVTTDPNINDIIRYQFNWGDGTSTTTGYRVNGAAVYTTHTWSSAGQYSVTVSAQDNTGRWSSASNPLTVNIIQGTPRQNYWVSSIVDYGSSGVYAGVNNPQNLLGSAYDDQVVGLYATGYYGDGAYVKGALNTAASGEIYLIGATSQGYTSRLCVSVSYDGTNWDSVCDQIITQTSPYPIYCGTHAGSFRYIAIGVFYTNSPAAIAIDTVRVIQ